VAVGRRAQLTVFGGDYKTKDGTGIRDYIHVMVGGMRGGCFFLSQTYCYVM
jgi:hypothetical protein